MSPLECVQETIDGGVTMQSILTPEGREKLLNPDPIDENPIPTEPQKPKPVVVDTSNSGGLQHPIRVLCSI